MEKWLGWQVQVPYLNVMQPSEPNTELGQSKMSSSLNYFWCCGGSYEIPVFNMDQRPYSHMMSLVIIWYKYITENVIGC